MSKGKNNKAALPGKAQLLIRLTAWTVALLFFALSGGIIALHLPSIQKEIILKGVRAIETATDFKVKIRSYRWAPFSNIHLTDVKVEAQGKQLLDCNKVDLEWGVSLRRPYFIVEKVYLEKPSLHIERSSDGKWFFPSPGGKTGERGEIVDSMSVGRPAKPLWIQNQLPHIQIISGSIQAVQPGNITFSAKDISATIKLKAISGANGPEVQMNFENFNVQAKQDEIESG